MLRYCAIVTLTPSEHYYTVQHMIIDITHYYEREDRVGAIIGLARLSCRHTLRCYDTPHIAVATLRWLKTQRYSALLISDIITPLR